MSPIKGNTLRHPLLVRQPDRTLVDHVVLGVPDFEEGLDYVESLTGIRPVPDEAAASTARSFVSARLSLSGGFNANLAGRQFLEVMAPNPESGEEYRGMGAYVAAMQGPSLLSWAIEVSDLDGYRQDAARAGYPFNDITRVHAGDYEYRRADIAVGTAPHVPSVIEWISRGAGKDLQASAGCRIADFTVHHPRPTAVQRVYDSLGMGMMVRRAEEPRLRLVLDTPRDDVILS